MAFDNGSEGPGRVAVDGTATLVTTGQGNGVTVAVKNTHATEAVAVGGPDVTFAGGYPLAAGDAIGFVADDGDDLYAISDGTSVDVAVLRQGV